MIAKALEIWYHISNQSLKGMRAMTETVQKKGLTRWRNLLVKIFTMQVLQFIMLLGHVAAIWLAVDSTLFPGVETIQSIASSFSEILAGLFGTTLAGYTFFLSRIDGLMASDASLDYVVVNVKNRFKHLIWFITGHVAATLFISLVLMYTPAPQNAFSQFLYRLFCNEFILNTFLAVVLILAYSVRVVNPNCLEKEAKKQKDKLSASDGAQGSVSEFISLYSQIVTICNARLSGDVLVSLQESKGKRFPLSLALLKELEPEWAPLLDEITRVHNYYSCVINCSPMTVTQEMCLIAQGILTQLNKQENKPEMP